MFQLFPFTPHQREIHNFSTRAHNVPNTAQQQPTCMKLKHAGTTYNVADNGARRRRRRYDKYVMVA